MNKEVINIAPEDDITDIISKIKNASQKIVAIVPPQPVGVLRSTVNIKLIVKTAEEANKVPVLVTSDPALLKLASNMHLPVTENLQTPPSVPSEEDLKSRASTPEKEAKITEDFVKPPRSVGEAMDDSDDEAEERSEEQSEELENRDSENEKNQKTKSSKTKNGLLRKIYDKFPWIEKNRKILFVSIIVLVLLAGFCVWAFAIAPTASVTVDIRASSNNFSENVTFVTKATEEDTSAGKFLLKPEKVEKESKVEFSATGKKDVGDKATGSVTMTVYFSAEGTVNIPSNTSFVYGGQNYLATTDTTISWDSSDKCENKDDSSSLVMNGCKISGTIKITAAEPGEKYNLDANKKDWTMGSTLKAAFIKSFSIQNTEAISGGNSKVVIVVQQSDIDAARAKFSEIDESNGKDQLMNKIPKNVFVLDETYKFEASSPTVSIKAGEEVPTGTTPVISSKATYTIYTVELSKIEDFIKSKATLGSDQEIYSLNEPFVERLNGSGDSYTGRLKTTYKTGPKITEEDILNKVLGRKVGEVQSLLKSINGIETVSVDVPYFWINRIPDDKGKITVNLKIDGENYQELREKISEDDQNKDENSEQKQNIEEENEE